MEKLNYNLFLKK